MIFGWNKKKKAFNEPMTPQATMRKKTGSVIGIIKRKNPKVVEKWKEMERAYGNDPHIVILELIEQRMQSEGQPVPARGRGAEDKLMELTEKVRVMGVELAGKQIQDGIDDIQEMEKSKVELSLEIDQLSKRQREEKRYVIETSQSADIAEEKVMAKEKRLNMLEERVIEQNQMLDNLRMEYDVLRTQQPVASKIQDAALPVSYVSIGAVNKNKETVDADMPPKGEKITYRRPRGRKKK